MKRISVLVLFTIVFGTNMHGQILGQDSEGYSTILVPSASLNLDIVNSNASFSFYKLIKKREDKPTNYIPFINCQFSQNKKDCLNESIKSITSTKEKNKLLIGFDLKGGVKEGITSLFSDEKITASSSLGGVIGLSFSRIKAKKNAAEIVSKSLTNIFENDSQIDMINDNVSTNLISEVSLVTGISTNWLENNLAKNTNEQIDFYDGRISQLKYVISNKNRFANDIKDLNKKEENLTILIHLCDEILGFWEKEENLSDENKKLIYEKFIHYKLARSLEYKDEMVKKPFDKELWKNEKAKVDGDKMIIHYELENLKDRSNASLENNEACKMLIYYYEKLRELYRARMKMEESGSSLLASNFLYKTTNLYYLRGSFNGSEFKYDLNNNAERIDERFSDKYFSGYTIEAGYTNSFKTYNFLGISASINYQNNINALKSTTYKLQKNDSNIIDGNFSTSEEIKALSGNYDTFLRYDLNFDYIRLISLKENSSIDSKSSQLYVSINPYIRHRIYEKSDILKNNTILGIGIHMYNSKDNRIMGGVFTQTNDLFGVHADDDSTIGKRITIGLIARFKFSGLKIE